MGSPAIDDVQRIGKLIQAREKQSLRRVAQLSAHVAALAKEIHEDYNVLSIHVEAWKQDILERNAQNGGKDGNLPAVRQSAYNQAQQPSKSVDVASEGDQILPQTRTAPTQRRRGPVVRDPGVSTTVASGEDDIPPERPKTRGVPSVVNGKRTYRQQADTAADDAETTTASQSGRRVIVGAKFRAPSARQRTDPAPAKDETTSKSAKPRAVASPATNAVRSDRPPAGIAPDEDEASSRSLTMRRTTYQTRGEARNVRQRIDPALAENEALPNNPSVRKTASRTSGPVRSARPRADRAPSEAEIISTSPTAQRATAKSSIAVRSPGARLDPVPAGAEATPASLRAGRAASRKSSRILNSHQRADLVPEEDGISPNIRATTEIVSRASQVHKSPILVDASHEEDEITPATPSETGSRPNAEGGTRKNGKNVVDEPEGGQIFATLLFNLNPKRRRPNPAGPSTKRTDPNYAPHVSPHTRNSDHNQDTRRTLRTRQNGQMQISPRQGNIFRDTAVEKQSSERSADGSTMSINTSDVVITETQGEAHGTVEDWLYEANAIKSSFFKEDGRDPHRAMQLFAQAANKGSAAGMVGMARLYELGSSSRGRNTSVIEQDLSRADDLAFNAYEIAPQNTAVLNLSGDITLRLKGYSPSSVKAARASFNKAALFGDVGGILRDGVLYFSQMCRAQSSTVKRKFCAQAMQRLTKAMEGGDGDAACYLGYIFESKDAAVRSVVSTCEGGHAPEEKSVEYFWASVRLGSARGMNSIGGSFEEAYGGLPGDFDKALEYYKMSFEAGYLGAAVNIGMLFELGGSNAYPDRIDAAKAFEWYTIGSSMGCPVATHHLGECYEDGRATARDADRAIELYEKAIKLVYASDNEFDIIADSESDLFRMYSWRVLVGTGDVNAAMAIIRNRFRKYTVFQDLQRNLLTLLKARVRGAEQANNFQASTAKEAAKDILGEKNYFEVIELADSTMRNIRHPETKSEDDVEAMCRITGIHYLDDLISPG